MTDHRAIAGHYNVHRVEAETKLADIGAIHRAREIPKHRKTPAYLVCAECGQFWPCNTTRILDVKAGA